MSTDAAREEEDAPPDRNRRAIALTATATLVGIAFSISDSESLGSVVTVGGFLALAWSLHRYGRSGPD